MPGTDKMDICSLYSPFVTYRVPKKSPDIYGNENAVLLSCTVNFVSSLNSH